MDLKIGTVVISKYGRDKGKYMAVINIKEDRVFLANGKERKLETPKPKNIKHIKLTKMTVEADLLTKNNALRKQLNSLNRKDEISCQKQI